MKFGCDAADVRSPATASPICAAVPYIAGAMAVAVCVQEHGQRQQPVAD